MFVYRLCLHCRWFWKARSTCETHLRHFEFAKFWYFVTWPFAEPKFASAHQISSKSDDSRLRYSDKAIFNMAAVRHLEFSKFDILVTWLVSERDSASDKRVYVWEGVLCVDCMNHDEGSLPCEAGIRLTVVSSLLSRSRRCLHPRDNIVKLLQVGVWLGRNTSSCSSCCSIDGCRMSGRRHSRQVH